MMRIKDLMTSHAEWIEASTPLRDASRTLRDKNIGCLPVGENDRLIGMITDRDICCRGVADGLDPDKATARDAMTDGVVWCYDDQTDKDAAELMEKNGIRHLPVLNRKKRIVGVLSLGDLAFRAGKSLTADVIHLVSRDAERHAKSA
jgi:CBS domain-containing protein